MCKLGKQLREEDASCVCIWSKEDPKWASCPGLPVLTELRVHAEFSFHFNKSVS